MTSTEIISIVSGLFVGYWLVASLFNKKPISSAINPNKDAENWNHRNKSQNSSREQDTTDIKAEKPKLKLFEYFWAGWPLIMGTFGGALGGLCGGAAMVLNVKIFGSSRSVKYKYGMTLLVSLASILIYFVATIVFLRTIEYLYPS